LIGDPLTYQPGDEIIHTSDEDYDILTVLRDCGDEVECFEYNPKLSVILKKEEVEPL